MTRSKQAYAEASRSLSTAPVGDPVKPCAKKRTPSVDSLVYPREATVPAVAELQDPAVPAAVEFHEPPVGAKIGVRDAKVPASMGSSAVVGVSTPDHAVETFGAIREQLNIRMQPIRSAGDSA